MGAVVGWEVDVGDAQLVERTRVWYCDDEDDGETWYLWKVSQVYAVPGEMTYDLS